MGPWLALVLLDLVTVGTFARCFNGPGELWVVVPVCLGAHLVAHGARIVSKRGHGLLSLLVWLGAVVFAALGPVALIDGDTFSWLLPLGHTQHVLGSQMHAAWHIFSYKISPVTQAPGLVLAAAWAAGILAIAAEALDADTSLPAIVALVPAFDIVMFTGTLGTAAGRAPELAGLAALAVWYLASTRRRSHHEQVVVARLEGSTRTTAPVAVAPSTALGRLTARLGTPVPGLIVVAALAAGVIGPLAPGAQSAAVVRWHGSGDASPGNTGGNNGSANSGPITVSDLVKVQEVEVDDANTELFEVRSPLATREVLLVLDDFNGNDFTLEPGGSEQVPTQGGIDSQVPPLRVTSDGATVTQVITNIDLGGREIPVPSLNLNWIAGVVSPTEQGSTGPIDGASNLAPKQVFEVNASIAPSASVAQGFISSSAAPAPAIDTYLPDVGSIPANIVDLAKAIVVGDTTLEERATAIQDFLLTHYRYDLPKNPAVTSPKPYAALEYFLFRSGTGYCQQFASAFTVLARIDDIPARIAVGFLPGTAVKKSDSYIVTGTDVHAWPQVYFPATGWIDFEPTPGSGSPVVAPVPTTLPPPVSVPSITGHGGGPPNSAPVCRSCIPAHNTGPNLSLPSLPTGIPHLGGGTHNSPGSHGGSGGAFDVLLVLVALAVLWSIAVPVARRVRWLRPRPPLEAVALTWHDTTVSLAAAGLHRRRAETIAEFGRRVRLSGVLPDEANLALGRLVAAANRAQFSGRLPSEEEAVTARRDARLVRGAAQHSISWWLRIAMGLDPRDLLAATS